MTKEKLIKLRCKAWGITEDEYYCNQCGDFSLEDMAKAYRRGKNRSRERIAELEAQIEKMQCCQNCDFFNYRFEACYYDKECKNKDHWKLRSKRNGSI